MPFKFFIFLPSYFFSGNKENALFLNFEAASFVIDTYKKVQIDL
jgi:hypothetical protein